MSYYGCESSVFLTIFFFNTPVVILMSLFEGLTCVFGLLNLKVF